MDFKRSTIVLIITFLFLDIFLFYSYFSMQGQTISSQNTNINVLEQMRSDDISFSGLSSNVESVPLVQTNRVNLGEKVSQLTDQTYSFENNILSSSLETPIELDFTKEISNDTFTKVTEFLTSGAILNGEQYGLFTYNPSTRKIIYTQRANKVPILDGTSQIVFSVNANGQVTSYEQTFAGDAQVLGDSRRLTTSQSAVENLYLSGRIPSKSTILKTRLVYYRSLSLDDMYVYSPAWYVEIQQADGQIVVRRVDALRGGILSGDSLEVQGVKSS